MKKLMLITMALAFSVFLVAGSVWALPFNEGRPYDNGNLDYTSSSGQELSLQEVFDGVISGGTVDAVDDQSSAALWTTSEGNVDSYLISLLSSADGTLGIYNTAGLTYDFTIGEDDAVSFTINDAGDLYVDGSLAVEDFGDTFGFYWETDSGLSYTEDDQNDGNEILVLSYLITEGLSVETTASGGTTVDALGNNDWILAFEDSGDEDFQDAVFYFEDMSAAVPEPATMLLLGSGLVGLGVFGRKRFFKQG